MNVSSSFQDNKVNNVELLIKWIVGAVGAVVMLLVAMVKYLYDKNQIKAEKTIDELKVNIDQADKANEVQLKELDTQIRLLDKSLVKLEANQITREHLDQIKSELDKRISSVYDSLR